MKRTVIGLMVAVLLMLPAISVADKSSGEQGEHKAKMSKMHSNMGEMADMVSKMSQMMNALTSIEYLEKRYPSPAVRLVAGTITIFLLGFYVLAQLIAGGKGMALVTGISYPIALAIGADATFVARSMDRDPKHMKAILQRKCTA